MRILLFSLATLLSAFLLFWVQPLFAKMILPQLGGSSSVWTTVMFFFQATLVCGYGYVHLSDRWLPRKRQAALHTALLLAAMIVLPFAVEGRQGAMIGSPVVYVLFLATFSVGLPFFALSATAPLLQRWYGATGRDPYFLYAASNFGSMAALLLFPTLLEPALAVRPQTVVWQAGYVLLVVLLGLCGLVFLRSAAPEPASQHLAGESPIGAATRFSWVFWAFLPSSAMLGVTSHVTTDIAPAALFWVLPLALYLLSFVVVFSRLRRYLPATALVWAVVLLAVAALSLRYWGGDRTMDRIMASILLNLLWFFSAACLLHGFLYHSRPEAAQLTEFYFWTACGGALGGIFNGVVAPLTFDQVLEYYLLLVVISSIALRLALTSLVTRCPVTIAEAGRSAGIFAVLLLLFLSADQVLSGAITPQLRTEVVLYALVAIVITLAVAIKRGHAKVWRVAILVVAVVVGSVYLTFQDYGNLYLTRSFYGSLRVKEKRDLHDVSYHLLLHGSTRHNMQRFGDDREKNQEPLMYFHRHGNIGNAVSALRTQLGRPLRFAIAGLGAGAMSAYTEVGDEMVFYEIDPEVVALATNPDLFTYVAEAKGNTDIVVGDARLQLAKAPDRHFDFIHLDAFCGDAVPVHLLTAEAIALYLRKVKEDGLVLFHLSNRYLDLPRVLQGAELPEGYSLYYGSRHNVERPEGTSTLSGLFSHSQVVLLARDEAFPEEITTSPRWRYLPADPEIRPWTDDYSNLLQIFRF
jgi:hypothetical protein